MVTSDTCVSWGSAGSIVGVDEQIHLSSLLAIWLLVVLVKGRHREEREKSWDVYTQVPLPAVPELFSKVPALSRLWKHPSLPLTFNPRRVIAPCCCQSQVNVLFIRFLSAKPLSCPLFPARVWVMQCNQNRVGGSHHHSFDIHWASAPGT